MNSTRKRIAGLLASACLAGVWGCGDSPPPVSTSRNEATVKGKVFVKGTPFSGGEISFDPSNNQRAEAPRTATIGADGTYSLKTLVGDNWVTMRGEQTRSVPELQFAREKVDVKDGDNSLDIKFLEGK
jgi:hypothetical protein